MTEPRDIEKLLREEGASVFEDRGTGPHLDDELIARHLAEGTPFDEAALGHLAVCAECREVVGGELTLRGDRASAWTRRLLAAVAAVAVAAVVFLVQRDALNDRSKGSTEPLTADVTVLAIESSQRPRVLFDGATVRSDEKLGFRYGNPGGAHSTVTILGWDGHRIHWYYPEAKGRPATPVRRDSEALSVRLPEDVGLEDHSPGALWIVAAFDTDPSDLAARIEKIGAPAGSRTLQLTVTSSAARR